MVSTRNDLRFYVGASNCLPHVYFQDHSRSLFFLGLNFILTAQDCKCTIERVNNQTVYSAGCALPQDICALEVGDNVNQVDLLRFTDLRGIHIKLGQNMQPTFSGSALSDSKTMFIAKGGVNMQVIDPVSGQRRSFQSDAGNNPNGIKAYNKEVSDCRGDCTLLAPANPAPVDRSGASFSAVMPVTLISWEVQPVGQGVELVWETEQETDNDYFTVLHSSNGIDFEEVGQVNGNGSTDRMSRCGIVDTEAGAGMHYYRLEQVDFDGTLTVLGLRQVRVAGDAPVIAASLSPNPVGAGGNVTVHLPDAAGTPVRLVDLAGRLVFEAGLDANGSFQVPTTLKAGMYVVLARDQATRLVVRP